MTTTNLSELRAQVEAAREPVGKVVEILDGFGKRPNTKFVEWTPLRYELPTGTTLYTLDPAIVLQLIYRLEAAERDAARWNWLMLRADSIPNLEDGIERRICDAVTREEREAAIDAAMAREKENQG